jgi:hypothetical protein
MTDEPSPVATPTGEGVSWTSGDVEAHRLQSEVEHAFHDHVIGSSTGGGMPGTWQFPLLVLRVRRTGAPSSEVDAAVSSTMRTIRQIRRFRAVRLSLSQAPASSLRRFDGRSPARYIELQPCAHSR